MPGKRVRNLRSRKVRKVRKSNSRRSRSSRRVRKSRRVRSTKRSSKSRRRRVSRKMRGGRNPEDNYQNAANVYVAQSHNEIQAQVDAAKEFKVKKIYTPNREEPLYESDKNIRDRAEKEEGEKIKRLTNVAMNRAYEPPPTPTSRKGLGPAAGRRWMKRALKNLKKYKRGVRYYNK